MIYQKYGTNAELDKMVNSDNWEIRREAARQQYGLDKLINDVNHWVRVAVAEQKYGLDILVSDSSDWVREAVARQGYGLHILVDDIDLWVRNTVAKQGYGLDKLIMDDYMSVCQTVIRYIRNNGYSSVNDWAEKNPDRVYYKDKEVTNDLKDFIYKVDESSKLEVKSIYNDIDEFFDNKQSHNSDELVICTIDTKTPIIHIKKTYEVNKSNYTFRVDIVNDCGDNFVIKTTITSKEQLVENLNKTIEALRLYKEFAKYADDLENCIQN